MSDDLVKRLRDWEHVGPEDIDKPEGHLYEEAADRIEELEAKLAKATDTLVRIVRGDDDAHNWAIWTLGELKGGKNE